VTFFTIGTTIPSYVSSIQFKKTETSVNGRSNAMNEMTIGRDQTEEDLIVYEISDEALETAAGIGMQNAGYTLGFCTGLSACPG
jgi:hypothetical protein